VLEDNVSAVLMVVVVEKDGPEEEGEEES